MNKLERFISAQEPVYDNVVQELKKGNKQTHWMWFIFPQIKGLGKSLPSVYYAIDSLNEAVKYLLHPVLSKHLTECSEILLELNNKTAVQIFGTIDAMKLRSSMTLFSIASKENPVFSQVLEKYYNGEKDEKTIDLLSR